MSNIEEPRFDSAGWGVFLVSWVVFSVPCVLFVRANAYNDTGAFVYIGMGIFAAGGIAGTFTWILNSILWSRAERIRERIRQQEKKTQKKKKKKSK